MTASYALYVLNAAGGRAALLDTTALAALRYERRLNAIAPAQFTLPLDDPRAALFQKHTLFEVVRYPDPATTQVEGTFMTTFRRRFADDDGRTWLIVSGVSLEFLLAQRHIDPRNDPLMAGGYSTKSDAVDTVMADLVYEQAGPGASAHGSSPSQQVPYLTVQTPAGVGDTVPVRLGWENLLAVLKDLAEGDRMDFRIARTSAVNLVFYAAAVGSDRTKTTNYPGSPFVMLRPELGTLRRPELVEDWRDERTVVHLLGKGAGDSRDFIGSMADAVTETLYSYASVVHDIRQVESGAEVLEQGYAALAKHRAKKTFTFEITHGYREVWDVGDAVTVAWGDSQDDMRINAVTVDVSGDGETITPEVRGRYES